MEDSLATSQGPQVLELQLLAVTYKFTSFFVLIFQNRQKQQILSLSILQRQRQ